MGDVDLTRLQLDVYASERGRWNPDHGEIELPEDWEFLPSGDAFVTRRVKAQGTYWLAWRPRARNRPHRRLLGLYGPRIVIEQAQAEAEATAARRAAERVQGARQRERQEDSYREEFAAAVRAWLAFAPQHQALADEIAVGAADQAAVVGSGRVGRTEKLPIEERAALAARAFIRHRFTDYEDQLIEVEMEFDEDDFEYRRVKDVAQAAVDDFLRSRRGH